MAKYRIYILQAGNRIMSFRDIDLPSKAIAIEQARAFDYGHGVELWRGERKLGVYRGDPEAIAWVLGKAP